MLKAMYSVTEQANKSNGLGPVGILLYLIFFVLLIVLIVYIIRKITNKTSKLIDSTYEKNIAIKKYYDQLTENEKNQNASNSINDKSNIETLKPR